MHVWQVIYFEIKMQFRLRDNELETNEKNKNITGKFRLQKNN